jgi:hypothetical protein
MPRPEPRVLKRQVDWRVAQPQLRSCPKPALGFYRLLLRRKVHHSHDHKVGHEIHNDFR